MLVLSKIALLHREQEAIVFLYKIRRVFFIIMIIWIIYEMQFLGLEYQLKMALQQIKEIWFYTIFKFFNKIFVFDKFFMGFISQLFFILKDIALWFHPAHTF